MPLSPSGVYTLPGGYLAVTGQDILPSQHNPPLEDIASVLSEAFYRTGVAPMLANFNFNTFKGLNLANGTNATDAINLSQLTGFATNTANDIIFTINNIMVQFASSVVTTTAGGGAIVTFPKPFTQTPTVVITNGDDVVAPGVSYIMRPPPAGVNLTQFNFSTSPLTPSTNIRVNWVAVGVKN